MDNIDTTGFVLKTKHDTDKSDLEKKLNDAEKEISDAKSLVKKTDLNAKITEIEGKIPTITGLATNSALTAVENKMPDINSFAKKTDYNTKISEIENKVSDNHGKCITTPEFNILAVRVFNARLAQPDLVIKTDFDIKLQDISERITSNKTKHLLVENELKKLKTFDLSYLKAKGFLKKIALKII